jgi:hypothetical protein
VEGCRWHWQRKKAAKPSMAVLIPIRAQIGASSATDLLSLSELLQSAVACPRIGFSLREVDLSSLGTCIGIWPLPRAEKPV